MNTGSLRTRSRCANLYLSDPGWSGWVKKMVRADQLEPYIRIRLKTTMLMLSTTGPNPTSPYQVVTSIAMVGVRG